MNSLISRSISARTGGEASLKTPIISSIIPRFPSLRDAIARSLTQPRKARTWPIRIEGPRSPCNVRNQAAPNRVQPSFGVTKENSRFSIRQSPLIKTGSILLASHLNATYLFRNLFTIALSIIFCASLKADAQVSVGIGSPGPFIPEESPAHKERMAHQVKINMAGNQPLRVSQSKIFNIVTSDAWKLISGSVYSKEGDILMILETKDFAKTGRTLAITNGPTLPEHETLNVIAVRIGTIVIGDTPLQLWDCGRPYIPPEPTVEQIKLSQEYARIRAFQSKQKAFEAQSNAVIWLAPQATNGIASAQYSLAIHYLNGQGCATNRELALEWLRKSADQGNDEAISELKKTGIK